VITPKTTWAKKVRLQAIETLAFWTGRVNTRDLIERFGISRRIAQSDITEYLSLVPGNLSYSRSEKAYTTTSIFKPKFINGQISEYIALESQACQEDPAELITQLTPHSFDLDPQVIQPVINAIKNKKGARIQYRSLNNPNGILRTIHPHMLVNTGFRWHVRAYCVERKEFRDFNLSRIGKSELQPEPRPCVANPDQDSDWQTVVKLHIGPNPHLSTEEKALLGYEFSMRKNKLIVSVRAALVPYTLHIYQIDPYVDFNVHPKRNRLVLLNKDKLEQHLWT